MIRMAVKKEKAIFYEKIDDLEPIFREESQELLDELEDYRDFKNNLDRLYEEIQDVSIVLLSLYNTVRLMKDGIIKEEKS